MGLVWHCDVPDSVCMPAGNQGTWRRSGLGWAGLCEQPVLTGGMKSHTHIHTGAAKPGLAWLRDTVWRWRHQCVEAVTCCNGAFISYNVDKSCTFVLPKNRLRLTYSLLFAKHCAGHEACSCDHERRVTLLHVPRQGATVDERHSKQTPLEQLSRPTSTTAHFACKSNDGMA